MGHWVLDFERSFVDLTGAKHAVGRIGRERRLASL